MTPPETPAQDATGFLRLRLPLRFRLAVFLAVFVGVVILLGGAAVWVGRSVQATSVSAMESRREAYDVGFRLKSALLRLSLLLAHYEWTGDSAAREDFLKESADVIRWLRERSRTSSSEAQESLQILVSAMDKVDESIRRVVVTTNRAELQASELATLARLHQGTPRLAELDRRFTEAQNRAVSVAFAEMQSHLDWLRAWSVASIALIAVLLALVGRLVWRDIIDPLRARVTEDEATIKRQEKLSALGTLAAGIAHEIRNPLNSIKARLHTQRRLLPDGSPAGEDNRVIQDEVKRLEQIVQDFLLFARPGEPRRERTTASVPLRAVAELLKPDLQAARVTLRLEVKDDPAFEADVSQLQQVLINLVRNALESMTGGGVLTLRSRAGRASPAAGKRPVAILEVGDTGPGIRPEVQARLFDPFFSTKPAGTGLGLSISSRIVQAHGGRLECQTQLSVGTVFRIVLPALNHDHAHPPEPDPRH